MDSRFLDLGPCLCRVQASDEVHVAMHHYVDHFRVPAGNRAPHLTVAIGLDTAAVARIQQSVTGQPPTTVRTSHPEQRYHVWIAADHEILLPEHAWDHVITTTPGLIRVAAAQAGVAAAVGVRVVRQLLMRGGEVRGGRSVHAAAVDLDGRGVLIAGHSGSGKTTTLTHLIEEHGARPVSNDRTMLLPTGAGRWQAVGVPLAVRITPEGISGSPTLNAALDHVEPARGRQLVDGKLELTPHELSTMFGRPTVPTTEVAGLVILARSPRVPAGSADGRVVRGHLGFGADDVFAADWLHLRPYLSDVLPGSRYGGVDLWERLADTVPVLALSWTDPGELPNLAAKAARHAAP